MRSQKHCQRRKILSFEMRGRPWRHCSLISVIVLELRLGVAGHFTFLSPKRERRVPGLRTLAFYINPIGLLRTTVPSAQNPENRRAAPNASLTKKFIVCVAEPLSWPVLNHRQPITEGHLGQTAGWACTPCLNTARIS